MVDQSKSDDLRMSLIRPAELWPAMLIGPIILCAIILLVEALSSQIYREIRFTYHYITLDFGQTTEQYRLQVLSELFHR